MPPTNQSQNLINPVITPLPSSVKIGRVGLYRSIALDALSIFSAFALGYSYHEYLVSFGVSPLFVVGTFLIFGIISALQALLCREVWKRAFIILCEVAILGSFFYDLYHTYWHFLLAAVLSAFILFFWGYLESRSEINYSTGFRPFKATKRVIGKVLSGMIIFMIVIYIPLWNQNSIFIPQKVFNVLFDWGAGVVNAFYPNIPISGSVGEFVNTIARIQLENVVSFKALSPENKNMLITQGATGIIDNFSKSIGISLQPSNAMSTMIYQFIMKTLIGWKDHLQSAFLISWGVAVFFITRSAGIILTWIDQFFFLFFYEILLTFGFMRIREEPWTRETIGF